MKAKQRTRATDSRSLGRAAKPIAVGYSASPLPKKLGFKDSTILVVLNEPAEYDNVLGPLPSGLARQGAPTRATTIVHVFVTKRQELVRHLSSLRRKLNAEAAVWVSWPKQASKVPTDITESTIREVALPLGFVDIKVCAVSEIWSGLKLVVRKELR
jgi:Protein of unknown function (DUF3052)